MRLTLSSESVRNAVFTNDTGQVLYKTAHPFKPVGKATTTIYKIVPNADPMDMQDQFEVVGEIEWRSIGSSTFRIGGAEMQLNTFLRKHGVLARYVVVRWWSIVSPDSRRFGLQKTDVYGTGRSPIQVGYVFQSRGCEYGLSSL